MEFVDLVKDSFGFLIRDYGFEFSYNNEWGDHYFFRKPDQTFEYYEWPQFGEYEFHIIGNNAYITIYVWDKYRKEIKQFKKQHRILKIFTKADWFPAYYDTIANIVKNEIETTGTLFGLKL